MADVSVTASNVQANASAIRRRGIAGEAITAGQPVYRNSSDGRIYRADANDTEAKAAAVGISVGEASGAGQAIEYQDDLTVTIGGGLTVGTTYAVSATVGGIAPVADLVTDDYVTILGVATTASVLKIAINVSGVQVP